MISRWWIELSELDAKCDAALPPLINIGPSRTGILERAIHLEKNAAHLFDAPFLFYKIPLNYKLPVAPLKPCLACLAIQVRTRLINQKMIETRSLQIVV